MSNKLLRIIFMLILSSSFLIAQDLFVRSAQIPVPANEPGGFGEVVSGLDLDGDGLLEIYAVNNNWGDTPDELIPRVYMWEQVGGTWTLQWSAVLGIPLQNTWPALTHGDLDADGKGEIIWGPVNNLDATTNPNPGRLIVFEANGNDNELGVSDGSGGWLPNSSWNMDVADMINMRPFKWLVQDVDNDGTDEVVFADRAGSASPYKFGVASVDDIPDNGGGSETWTLEYSGAQAAAGFVRSGVLDADPVEPGGFGNIIAGVDFDGDGKREIYAVNDNWGDTDYEVTPRMYKWEWNGAYWEVVWSTAVPGVPAQNTWPALAYADTDGDGKMEIFWGPVNFLTTESQNPSRVVVYESDGTTDAMGVMDGDFYKPNAEWSILDADGGNERPFKWVIEDVDGDGTLEIIYGARAGNLRFGVISVSNIPDNADGSENWSLEASALTAGMTVDAGTIYDLAVIDNFIYLIHSSGNVTPIAYEGGNWVSKPVVEGIVPGGSWNSAWAVDLDENGQEEIVVGQWVGGSQVFLLQPAGDGLTATTIGDFAALGSTRLNGGHFGDVDGDGKLDFVYGSRTTLSTNDATIYRLSYAGGDVTDPNNYTESIIDHSLMVGGQWDVVVTGDINGNGRNEVLYSGVPRSAERGLPIGVISYTDGVIPGGSKWDIAIANGNVYTVDNNGSYNKFQYINDGWQLAATLTGVAGDHGSFKGSVVVDADGDGTEEIIVGAWGTGGAGKVYLLKEMNGGLMSAEIADLGPLGAVRLNGADAGDIDGDGYIDVVFGSRGSGEKVFRIEYRGGDIDNSANWAAEMIDELVVTGDQLDIINIANVDADADLEVIYSGIPRGGTAFPITILDIQKVQTTPIADVRVDANGDFQPDNDGQVFTVLGVVTSYNAYTADLQFWMQDATGGIVIYGNDVTTVNVEPGQLVQVTGTVGQFRGTTQLEIADASGVVMLGVGTIPAPKVLYVDEYLSNAEMYESMLIKFNALGKASGDWPAEGANGFLEFTDGYRDLTVFIDKEWDMDGTAEPVYPVSAVGVASQYTSSASVYNDGYDFTPTARDLFEEGKQVPPHPYMMAQSPADGATVDVTSTTQSITISWTPTTDLNNDPVIYQFVLLPNIAEVVAQTNSLTITGQQVLGWLGGQGEKTFDWTVRTTDQNNPVVHSKDTSSVTFVNKTTDVDEQSIIPAEFFVDQNYPNPFNPTTTIQFGLPEAADVNLVVYDMLGREVATLISNRSMNAGYHTVIFNANALASGHYIYKLTAGQKTEIKKMLLLK